MTEENKPVRPLDKPDETIHTGESTAQSSNFQPTIDTNQAGATEAYGEGSIQIRRSTSRGQLIVSSSGGAPSSARFAA